MEKIDWRVRGRLLEEGSICVEYVLAFINVENNKIGIIKADVDLNTNNLLLVYYDDNHNI